MEVYYKFKSAKDYDSIPIDWHYTTVSDLKDYLLEKKCSGKRNKTHYDNLFLFNADTNQEYLDGQTLIPKNTFLIIRRAPRCVCLPIVINPPVIPEQEDNPLMESKLKEDNSFDEPSTSLYPQESEWVEFWNDLSPSQVVVPVQDAPHNKADEDRKIRELTHSSALDWRQHHNPSDSFGAARGFGHGGMGGRSGGLGFGRGGLADRVTPPPCYICHRCKVPGHFIQHCPTNGDPAFDIKRNKPPTGIPNSMLLASPDGSYALPGGGVAVLKPNEAAFEKEIQGIPSTRSVVVLPAELHCPLCKAVMKDAVLASKCCFQSFCDKCIRDYIMSKSLCTCGAINVLADDLLPNKTVRDTIFRILESTNGSGANGGAFHPQDRESAPCPQPKIPCSKVPSPTLSAPSKGIVVATKSEGNTKVEEMIDSVEAENIKQKTLGKVNVEVNVGKGVDVSEAVHDCARERGSQICPPVTDEDMQPKIPCSKVPSHMLSAPSKGVVLVHKGEGNTKVGETKLVEAGNIAQETLGKVAVRKGVEVSETAHECVREPGSQICPPVTDEGMQPKTLCSKVPSPMLSAPSKGIVVANKSEGNIEVEEMIDSGEADNITQKTLGKMTVGKGVKVSEAAYECAREPRSEMCPPVTDEEIQQKPISGEVEKRKKKFTDMQSRPHRDFADMPLESSGYNPYWNCMQPEFDGFGRPYFGQIPFMGCGLGPVSIQFGGSFYHNTLGAQYMMPIPSQRGLAKFGAGSNGEFYCWKTTIKQKRDQQERSGGSTHLSRDRDFNGDMISHEDIPSVKSHFKSISPPDYKLSPESSTHDPELTRTSSKRKVKHDDDILKNAIDLPPLPSKSCTEKTDWKHKSSVFARMTSPEEESAVFKKRKLGNSSSAVNGSNHRRSHSMTSNRYHEDQCKTSIAVSKNIYKYANDHDYESNEDDRHFKIRPSRYGTSPVSVVVHGRHSSRGWREKKVIAANTSRLSVY